VDDKKPMPKTGRLKIERSFDAPIERVWRAFTDPGNLTSWFAKEANARAEHGGPHELFWEPENSERNSTIRCRLTYVEPRKWLAFTWRGPSLYDDPMNYGDPPLRPTHATVRFEGRGAERTVVHIEHVGWCSGQRWSAARAWHERAWNNDLDNLAAMLDGNDLPHPWFTGSKQ
jgi:uncharacterized protein YndB with AHSA1/START domain